MPLSKVLAASGKPGLVVFKPATYDASKKYPLVVFLHGIGERGDGSDAALDNLLGFINTSLKPAMEKVWNVGGKSWEFVLVAPQLPSDQGNWSTKYSQPAFDWALANLSVETTKVYLTGVSLGGGGVWNYGSSSTTAASKLAAAAPVCGVQNWTTLCNMKGVGVWAFHAADDPTVASGNTISAVNTLTACPSVVTPKATIYPAPSYMGHYIWDKVYGKDVTPGIANESVTLWEWFLMCSVGAPVAVPVVTPPAGSLQAVTAPVENITSAEMLLDGSLSTGPIVSYDWVPVSGPSWTKFPDGQSGAKIRMGGMVNGKYVVALFVKDSAGNSSRTDKTVNVDTSGGGGGTPPVPTPRLTNTIQVFSDGTVQVTPAPTK